MTIEVNAAIKRAFDYLSTQKEDIPNDIWLKSLQAGIFKAEDGDFGKAEAAYGKAVEASLTGYLDGGSLVSNRNTFKRATVEAFGFAFDTGWKDGGGSFPADGDALQWFNARIEAEFGFIDLLFQQAKELRKEEGDHNDWIAERVQGYAVSMKEIYNNAKLRALPNMMATFDGEDGANPCDTCKKLKGKRHKLSWFIKRDYVPPHGSGLDCAKGGKCLHYLRNDKKERITI